MELYVGGYKQGKLKYVMGKYKDTDTQVEERVFNDFHLWVRELMEQKKDVDEQVQAYLEQHPDCIIICDEIGNGIVPMDPFERAYREKLGRLLADIAQQAEHVERVICGLGVRLK